MLAIIALTLIVLAATVFFYNRTLNDLATAGCIEVAALCPYQKVVETQNIIIAILVLVIGAVVAWIFFYSRKKPDERVAPAPTAQAGHAAHEQQEQNTIPLNTAKHKKIDLALLDADEKKIIAILQENQGSTFQSDIAKKMGYSKVKVSRMLDRLEQKGLLERKRRGMTNLVVLR